MHRYIIVLLILNNKMKKWFKIILSGIICVSIYYTGLLSLTIGNKENITHLLWWLLLLPTVIIITIPVYKYWWNKVNKWLWGIQPTIYSKHDVLLLFQDFLEDVKNDKMKNHDDFKKWLNNKGL